ncbi:DUF2796 domain-containing protein [Maricaulaceae bacterium EIL42A08]|nr:DUF2796 domain-containing protein [Maricaulaceae bacterium EIL42A08]
MYRLLLASLTLSAAPAALAQDAMTQLGAHVHGESALSIGLDPVGGDLVIEMSGPAYNLYGFERAPASEAETALVASVQASLSQAGLFTLSERAGCSFVSAEISDGEDDHHEHGDHEHHDHEEHGHDHDSHDHGDHHGDHGHEHDHDGHADHDDHEHADEHDHDEHSHSDIRVTWSYACETPVALTRIDAAPLFAALTSLERLDTQFFDGERAAAAELSRSRTNLVID